MANVPVTAIFVAKAVLIKLFRILAAEFIPRTQNVMPKRVLYFTFIICDSLTYRIDQ